MSPCNDQTLVLCAFVAKIGFVVTGLVACLLEFYLLATSNFISGRVLACYRAHLWRCYIASPLGAQGTSTMN